MSVQNIFDFVSSREAGSGSSGSEHVAEASLYERLVCTNALVGHTGCVNALDWNEEGDLLASGSDDTNLCLWSPLLEEREGGRRPAIVHATEHTANIFGVRFLPGGSDNIATVAGDCRVQLHRRRDDGSLASEDAIEAHLDRVKRLDAHPEAPNLFLTASEDGTIRQFDIRDWREEAVFLVADWSKEQISLNSLSISPLRPWLVAAAGSGRTVRIIDRRMLSDQSSRLEGRSLRSRHFLYDHAWMPVQKFSCDMVCAVKFKNNSMDLLASFINDNIYETNVGELVSGRLARNNVPYLEAEEKLYNELQAKWLCKDYDGYYTAANRLAERHGKLQYRTLAFLRKIFIYEALNAMAAAVCLDLIDDAVACAIKLYEMRDDYDVNEANVYDANVLRTIYIALSLDEDDSHVDSCVEMERNHSEALSDLKIAREKGDRDELIKVFHSLIPIHIPDMPEWLRLGDISEPVAFSTHVQRSYTGHANTQTVKDLSLVGLRGDFVASGSDGGHFFIWDARGGEINVRHPLFMGYSDTAVVNCIAQHPKLPLLAVSGIDHDIKLWEPGSLDDPMQTDQIWLPVPVQTREALMQSLANNPPELPAITIPCHVQ